MQLLSALEPIVEMLWLAICAAAIFLALGMIVHATVLLARRLRAASAKRCGPSGGAPVRYAVVSTLAPGAPAADPFATVTMAGRSRRP